MKLPTTHALKPYPELKDSGVEWFDNVPGHWDVTSLRRRLRAYDGIKIGPFGSQLKLDQMSNSGYKVYGQANVISNDFLCGTKFISQEKFDELAACEVLPGDLLVTMMGTSGRCAGVPSGAAAGIMDSHLLRLRLDDTICPKFAVLLIDESPYIKQQITVSGKGSIMHGLNSGMIKALIVVIPPLPEQAAIVRFLDRADRRIQRYIRAKQKLIVLLDEQKQAIIHQAVTGKIDVRTGQPFPAYRDSGVRWLGEVPMHWAVKRLKFLAYIPSSLVDPRLEEHRHKVLIAPNHIAPRLGKITDFETAEAQGADSGKHEVTAGDVVYSKIRPNLRKAAISPVDGICSADIYPIRVRKDEINPSFFLQLLLSNNVTRYTVECSMRVAMPKINREALGDCWLLYPTLADQTTILEWINFETARSDVAIQGAEREIDLLHEYRTRLISDVVTGKLDVREAAAELPEEDVHRDTEKSADEYAIETDVTV